MKGISQNTIEGKIASKKWVIALLEETKLLGLASFFRESVQVYYLSVVLEGSFIIIL